MSDEIIKATFSPKEVFTKKIADLEELMETESDPVKLAALQKALDSYKFQLSEVVDNE